jgi:hypothetical protein
LLKEPVCIGALGISIDIIYKMFIGKHFSFRNLLLLGLLCYTLTVVKGYIMVIFLISVSLVFIWRLFFLIRNLALRIGIMALCIFIVIVSVINFDADRYLDEIVYSSYTQIESFQNSYEAVQADDENSKAGFAIGEIKPTFSSLVLHSPAVIASCLFRPFIWESRKIIILFAALEASVIFLATLFVLIKTKFLRFFYYIFNNPYRLFCFIFSMLFALLVGYTTYNFGTMVRYKIIFLPFYFFLLINIYTTVEGKKERKA